MNDVDQCGNAMCMPVFVTALVFPLSFQAAPTEMTEEILQKVVFSSIFSTKVELLLLIISYKTQRQC